MTMAGLYYAATALTSLLLGLLLFISGKTSAMRYWWSGAALVNAAWAGTLSADLLVRSMPPSVVFDLEMARDSAWLLLLTAIGSRRIPRLITIGVWVACCLCLIASVAIQVLSAMSHRFDWPFMLAVHSVLLLSILGLVLIEQLYRGGGIGTGKAAYLLAVGLGGQFAFDLYLYAQAELFHHVSAIAWSARGLLCALSIPIIAIAAKANRDWAPDLFVSRQIIFYTSAIVSVGIYLCAMAAGGYYIRSFGGSWGRPVQLAFLIGAALVLASLLLSGTVRRRCKVFLSKNFYRNKYDYRAEWLRFANTILQADGDPHQLWVRAVAQVVGSPGGALFVRNERGDHFDPVCVWPGDDPMAEGLKDVVAETDLVRLLSHRCWIVDQRAEQLAPREFAKFELPDWLRCNPELRMVVPILRPDTLSAFLVLRGPPDPFELTYEDRDLLLTLGRHIATLLAQHQMDRRLAESRQFDTFNRLTAFMMHDLKNSMAQLQLVISNAAKHRHNPKFIDDALNTIQNASQRMARLVEQLQIGRPLAVRQPVRLDELVYSAKQRCAVRLPVPVILESSAAPIVEADPDRLTSVIEHVIRNAQDATPASGRVALEVTAKNSYACVVVEDSGKGMQPEFVRNRLFRPFDSTKGSSGMGIGACQVRDYISSLGGHIEVQSKLGVGTRFSVTLPALGATP
jgi:putative PEP-CTERM system histidine kinase